MSIEIDWDKLFSNNSINEQLTSFLNNQLSGLELPEYLNDLKVTSLSMGNKPPEITIRHIEYPFQEFYASKESHTDDERRPFSPLNISPLDYRPPSNLMSLGLSDRSRVNDIGIGNFRPKGPKDTGGAKKGENDIQFVTELKFDGDFYMEVTTNLLLNYPTSSFISLPVKLKLTELFLHSMAVIAYLDNKVVLSFLCDVEDDTGNAQDSLYYRKNGAMDRMDVIKKLKIEGELGNYNQDLLSAASNGSILRNIGKIEKFLVKTLKGLLINELGWPSWIELDFSDEE